MHAHFECARSFWVCLNGPFAPWTSSIQNISSLWPINWNSIVQCHIHISFKIFHPIVRDDLSHFENASSPFFSVGSSFVSVFVVKTFWASDHLQIPITINCLKHVLSASYNATTTWTITMGHNSIWALKFLNGTWDKWTKSIATVGSPALTCSNEWCANWGACIVSFFLFFKWFRMKKRILDSEHDKACWFCVFEEKTFFRLNRRYKWNLIPNLIHSLIWFNVQARWAKRSVLCRKYVKNYKLLRPKSTIRDEKKWWNANCFLSIVCKSYLVNKIAKIVVSLNKKTASSMLDIFFDSDCWTEGANIVQCLFSDLSIELQNWGVEHHQGKKK